jgi:SOS response regulatory protein OraA/RecX
MAESDLTGLTTSGETVYSEADSGWKEAIEIYFKQFLSFFFPIIYDEVDLEKGYQFLDKELEKIVKASMIGKRFADKLVKVGLRDGTEKWLLIHLEVQGYYDTDFVKRMYTYNYRIFDRYDEEVISLAILTDNNQCYRHCRYEINRWGFRHLFEFPVIKLIDYNDRVEELKASRNPFGIIVVAHLKTLETKKDDQARFKWKLSLVKALYHKGFSREDVLNLYRFIDWLMVLPKELDCKFQDEIKAFEEGMKVAYITSAERIGIEKGKQEGLQEGIEKGVQKGKAQAFYDLYCEGVLTLEQAKAQLEKLYANKSLSEEIYREFMSKIQSNS